MKNFISFLFLVILFSSNAIASNNNPVNSKSIFKKADVEFSVMNVKQLDFFKHADYNDESKVLEFVTKESISYIQIFKGDKLEYQLPVMSNKLKIGRAVFGKGVYKLGFITEEGKKIEFTQLEVNK